jgi:hypothetical protein
MPGKYKTEEIRKLIVEAKQKGEYDKDVAARFHVNQSTVSRIWSRWKATKSVKTKKKTGRPRKTTAGQRRLLVRHVKKDPFMTAVDLMEYAPSELICTKYSNKSGIERPKTSQEAMDFKEEPISPAEVCQGAQRLDGRSVEENTVVGRV